MWISFKCTRSLGLRTNLNVLNHLAQRGHDVYLLTTRAERRLPLDNSKVHLTLVPFRYLPIITPFLFAIIVLVYLPFYVAIRRPDIIVTETGPSIFSFVWNLLFSRLRFKTILDVRTTPVEVNDLRRYLDQIVFFRISVQIAKGMFDGITTLTNLMKREICEEFRIDPEFVGVWTSGVSTTLFDPKNYNGLDLKKEFGLADKFVVFYHGNFYYFLSHVIESIKLVKIERDLVLFLLGSGPALPIFRELVQRSGIEDKVIIHDAVDYKDVPKFIAMCDVGIVPLPDLPDWRHQCPLKLLEYLAMEKVVIVTDIPANREVAGKSRCSIYIPSVDPVEISKAITHAYNNREKLKEWGAFGRVITEERYSWEQAAKDLENYTLRLFQGNT